MMDEWMDRWKDGNKTQQMRLGRWMDGWMGRWIDGEWMEGGMGRQMSMWVDG